MARDNDGRTQTPRKRRRYVTLVGIAIVAALVWFAPAIVVMSPLRYVVLDQIRQHYTGVVTYDSASVGWLSPVILTNLRVHDLQGEVLLAAKTIQTEKPLYALLSGGRNVGRVTVSSPEVFLTVRADGSNFTDALATPDLQDDEVGTNDNTPSQPIGLTLEIIGGSAEIVDVVSKRTFVARELAANISVNATADSQLEIQLDSKVGLATGSLGEVYMKVTGETIEDANGLPFTGDIELQTVQFPLAITNAFVEPLDVCTEGWLNSDLHARVSESDVNVRIEQLEANDLTLSAPAYLHDDVIRLARTTVQGRMQSDGSWVSFESFAIRSDVANVDANVSLAIPQSVDQFFVSLEQSLEGVDQQVKGDIDAAALAAMLPQTLRLRDGAKLTAGRLSINLQNVFQQDVNQLVGQATATGFAGELNGRPIQIGQPIDIRAVARQTSDGPVIEQLTGLSAFLNFGGSASIDEGQIELTGDLNQFVQQWGSLLDLDDVQLAGTMQGVVRWQRDPNESINLHSDMTVQQFELVAPQIQPWREQQMKVVFDGRGKTRGMTLSSVDEGRLTLASGADTLRCELTKPITDFSTGQPITVKSDVVGSLETWQARLQPIVQLPDMRLAGGVNFKSSIVVEGSRTTLNDIATVVTSLRCDSETLAIAEPQINVQGSCSWDSETSQLESTGLTFASSALAFRADDVSLKLADEALQGSGKVGFRGDVARLNGWLRTEQPTRDSRLGGNMTGQLTLVHQGALTKLTLNTLVDQLSCYTRDAASASSDLQLAWSEPNVQVVGDATYDTATDQVVLTKFQAGANNTGSVVAAGTLSDLMGACNINVKGQMTYDLQRVGERLRPIVGTELQMAGAGTRDFDLQGPLFSVSSSRGADATVISTSTSDVTPIEPLVPAELTGQASVAWESIRYAGLNAERGAVATKLTQGIIAVDPIDVRVSGGQMTAKPRIVLNEDPALIVLDKGPIAKDVQISPEMCRGWLKYVAPMMANATQVQGRFSAELDGAILPLAAPTAGNVKGRMQVHTARVGAGPMSREFLTVIQQVATIVRGRELGTNLAADDWLDMPEQTIEFQMVDNVVHHNGLTLVAGDVVVRTKGSVGLDQTVNIIAEIPVRDEWAQRSEWLAGLRGQSFQVPIRGTLTKPSVDKRVLEQVGKQALRGSANKLIEEGLNRGLKKLFGN